MKFACLIRLFMHVTVTACSIHQDKLIHKNTVHTWTYDLTDENDDIMANLHKHKMGARDSMLGDLISTCFSNLPNFLALFAKLT